MKFRYIRSAAAIFVCTAMLAGCYGTQSPADTSADTEPSFTTTGTISDTSENSAEEYAESAGAQHTAAALASENEHVAEKEMRPLTAAVSEIYPDASPFGKSGEFYDLMNDLTGVKLLGKTRRGKTILHGIRGEKEYYNGELYDYNGLADIDITYDEENGTAEYTFTLRRDVVFSDGEPLTADDVIFTLYAMLDPSNTDSSLFGANIVGADNYRFDSAIAETLTDDEIAEALASEEIIPLLKERLILPVLTEQYKNVCSLYEDDSAAMGTNTYDIYTEAYPYPDSLFVFLYSLDPEYTSPEGASADNIISDIADMYGGNYRLLASMTVGSVEAFDLPAKSTAIEYITNSRAEEDEAPSHITSVSGITRLGDNKLSITVRGNGRELESALCDIVIAPLHYYGNESAYNYESDKFGFEKGKAGAVYEAHPGEPVGAGAYKFKEYADESILLEANEMYYNGTPLASEIKLIRSDSDDAVSMIADGTADICSGDGSAACFDEIDEANRKLEKIYAAVSGGLGYGYIGMNANTVNVSGKPLSQESSYLRKGIATVINFFKEDSVKSYYGDHCTTACRPYIDNIDADRLSADEMPPYTTDIDGEPVCDEKMTYEQRRDAVKKACLGYLEAAGYTLSEDGSKIAEAPDGGKLTFSAVVAGGGNGAHPAYYALSEAANLLSEIGITLTVTDISDPTVLWTSFEEGIHEIWAGSWNNTLREIYADGYYNIGSEKLDELIDTAENAPASEKLSAYTECYVYAMDELAVEIPMYRRSGCMLFSTQRVDVSTIPGNTSGSYKWTREIEKIGLR